MATNNSQRLEQLSDLSNRLDWIDEERRKTSRRLTELEQRVSNQTQTLEGRDKRIGELEEKLSKATTQLARLSQVDAQLRQFKDEMVKLIEQYDQRRVSDLEELDKLRRVEHEVQQREIAAVHKEVSVLGRLQNDLELRQAEEARLANLIGMLQGKIDSLANQVDPWTQQTKFLEENDRSHARSIAELQTSILENSKRMEPLDDRLEIATHNLAKAEASIQNLADTVVELKQRVKSWEEQVQTGEYERNRRLDDWRHILDEQQAEMNRFATEWVRFTDLHKQAKSSLDMIEEWRQRLEQQQREVAELARVEANRMRALWEAFELENEKRWATYEVDDEQRWVAAQRQLKQLQEQIDKLSESISDLEQEKDLLWRVQAAQADAMKKWPRIWLEEIEKAIAHNPSSRRQPALVPVREE